MKKLFPSVILCFLLCGSAFALSPALDILSQKLEEKRCITDTDVVTFKESDFEEYFGENVSSITVNTLPDSKCGVLSCGAFELSDGQSLSRDSFSLIRFVPVKGFEGQASFSFKSNDSLLTCNVNVSPIKNSPPVTGAGLVETQKNIAVFSLFSAADADNDALTFEIVKYPRHGSIQINNTDGMFVYRPHSGYVGQDSFSYIATDSAGNKSAEQKQKIKVSKPACDVYFSDMQNHWAHNAAVKMASTGLMVSEEGTQLFNPDSPMTRGDFLALSLIMAGYEKDIPYTTQTPFSDNSLIPQNIRSYACYAYDNGIINGYSDRKGGVYFDSTASITRAEAAVMLEKILCLDSNHALSLGYTDAAAIPSWAASGIGSLTACGIIKGEPSGQISAQKVLSRAEGAQMICNAASYLRDKEQQQNKSKKSIFNLFGLLN